MLRSLIAASLMWPGLLAAQTFTPLTGAEIEAKLNDTFLVYKGGHTQLFRASGRTIYNNGSDSLGYWRVRGDQYCSEWPPAGGWDCYDMEEARTETGEILLRFIGPRGGLSTGTVTEQAPG